MTMMSIRKLIDIYNELDSAIFFDGIGEFLKNESYTDEEWKDKANQFLDEYQRLLIANATVAKYDYFLHEKERDELAEYCGMGIDLARIDPTENRPDEPFEGYFELMRKMAIPANVLRKTLKETGNCLVPQELPISNNDIDMIGDFLFEKSDDRVAKILYKDKTLKMGPQPRQVFYYIMCNCYGNKKTLSFKEIGNACKIDTDDDNNLRKIVSDINGVIRRAAKKGDDERLVASAPEIGPRRYKIDHNFISNS